MAIDSLDLLLMEMQNQLSRLQVTASDFYTQ